MLKVFVSSIQVELSNERTAITELVHADPFLSKYVEAVLFENQPAYTEPAEAAYLDDLDACDVYLGVLGFEYGIGRAQRCRSIHLLCPEGAERVNSQPIRNRGWWFPQLPCGNWRMAVNILKYPLR